MAYVPVLGACLFLLFALYMAHHAWHSYRNARLSLEWPATDATILQLRLWGNRRIDGEMVECEHLSVAYRYSVDGTEYTGADAAFYTLHYPETLEFATRHPVGSPTTARYNPDRPSESVLEPGPHPTKPHGGLVIAALAVFVSLAAVIFMAQDLP